MLQRDVFDVQERRNRPGRTPNLDPGVRDFIAVIVIAAGGSGSITLPSCQRGLMRKWLYLVVSTPGTPGTVIALTVAKHLEPGEAVQPLELLRTQAGAFSNYAAIPVIGTKCFLAGVGGAAQPWLDGLPEFINFVGDDALIQVTGQTGSVNLNCIGRYTDIPL